MAGKGKFGLDAKFFLQLAMSFMTSLVLGGFAAAACAIVIRNTVLYAVKLANHGRSWTPGCWSTLPGDKYLGLFYFSAGGGSSLASTNDCIPTEELKEFVGGFAVCCMCMVMCFAILHISLKEHKMVPIMVLKQIVFLVPAFGLWSMFFVYHFERCVNTPRWFVARDAVVAAQGTNGNEHITDDVVATFMKNGPLCMYSWLWWQRMIFYCGMATGAIYATGSGGTAGGTIKNIVLHSIAFITLYGFMMIMGFEFPKYYQSPYGDSDKVMVRLVYFTFAVEFIALFFRRSYNVGLGTQKLGYMFFAVTFGCMYGRILVSAVSDTGLLLLSSAGVGIIEIGSRLTAFQRDAMIIKMANKIMGKGKLDKLQQAEMQKRKAGLVVLETECEMGSIFYSLMFFLMVLSLTGPLQYAAKPAYNRVQFRDMFGYDVVPYLLRNTFIQVGVELLTDGSSFMFEVIVVKINPWTEVQEDGKGVFFRVLLCVFFFFFSMIFTSALFYFPLKPGYSLSTTKGFDLDDTWIYVIPNTVDMSYMVDFTEKYFKKNPIESDYDYGK